MPRRKPKVSAAQRSFGAMAGDVGMVPASPPESTPARRAVPAIDVSAPLYVGRGHGQFIELLGEVERGQRECRLDHCPKCKREMAHIYVCLQRKGPRIWGYICTGCTVLL